MQRIEPLTNKHSGFGMVCATPGSSEGRKKNYLKFKDLSLEPEAREYNLLNNLHKNVLKHIQESDLG